MTEGLVRQGDQEKPVSPWLVWLSGLSASL